jgi:hypothetical protein
MFVGHYHRMIAVNREYASGWLSECKEALDKYFGYSSYFSPKKTVLFGAGKRSKAMLKGLFDIGVEVAYLVDNNPAIEECEFLDSDGDRHLFAVKPPKVLLDDELEQLALLIAAKGAIYEEIEQQLCEMGLESAIY